MLSTERGWMVEFKRQSLEEHFTTPEMVNKVHDIVMNNFNSFDDFDDNNSKFLPQRTHLAYINLFLHVLIYRLLLREINHTGKKILS
jgi:hypothetical protein